MSFAIETNELTYKYPNDKVGLAQISFQLPWHSRTLLIGSNGAGKSTLLRLLAGKTLNTHGTVRIDGNDPFKGGSEANAITTYLGCEWVSNPIIKRDMSVMVLINSMGGDAYPERRDKLIDMLDIDITWRTHTCSTGQLRRVQLAMGLIRPWKVLLLDEVTVDVDVIGRSRLLQFLKEETENRECSIIYATHIFDGLGQWPTHVMHLKGGQLASLRDATQLVYRNEVIEPNNIEKEIGYEKHVLEKDGVLNVKGVHSFHPIALEWLSNDLFTRGTWDKGDLNRPSWEELKAKLGYFDSPGRFTDYFKATRG